IASNGNLASLNSAGHSGFAIGFLGDFVIAISRAYSFKSIGKPQSGESANFDPGHTGDLRDDICAHFARANKANTNWLAGVSPCSQIAGEANQGNICGHYILRKNSSL